MQKVIELSHKPLIRAYSMDCMELMAGKGEDYYELCIVDPPYGIGEDGAKNHSRGKLANATKFTPKKWDNEIPSKEYFVELMRVSKNQIIWGGSFFLDYLGASPCFVVWDKVNGATDFADCELAWTSFNTATRKFKWMWNGMLQQNMGDKEHRIHPTQKPVSLYRWLLTNYAKPGQTILDTHGGSFSSAIACWHEGYNMDICELDEEYFEAACERFERETRQQKLFDKPGELCRK